MKFQTIARRRHLLADPGYVPLVATAPFLARFEDQRRASKLCRLFSGADLVYTLLTRAEWSPFRLVPFRVHVTLDLASGIVALFAPWVFGFYRNTRARNTFLAKSAAGRVVGLLSRPYEMQETENP